MQVIRNIISVIQSWFGVYNAKRYGARGNGTTDDRAAIQAVLDAAKAAGGGVVFLPPGTYLIKRPLFIGSKVTLQGAGRGVTTITKPASVKSLLTANASAAATSVTVADGSIFAVGGAIHLYDTSSFEWLSTQGTITNIAGNVITFTNAEGLGRTGLDGALQTARSATATTSFPLLRNDLAATRIVVRDLTLDHNQNANDPSGSVTDFTLATIHLVESYYGVFENIEITNAAGDSWGDQAQDMTGVTPAANLIKTTKNTIRNSKIRNATRHGVHVGSCMNGAFVQNNEITSCAGYAMFYCAYATYTVATGNLVENCGSGFAGVDYRDYGNVIASNVIKGTTTTAIDAYSSGTDGTGGKLVITGNYILLGATGSGIRIDQPDCTISGNVIEMIAGDSECIRLQTNADRGLVIGNQLLGASAAGSTGLYLDLCDDVRVIGNTIKNMQKAASLRGLNRLVALGNAIISPTSTCWRFESSASTDCVIRDDKTTFATPVTEDVATVRLVYGQIGTNGSNDPASAGDWNAASGRRFDGQMVRWNSGGGEKVSIFYNGVGWTALN